MRPITNINRAHTTAPHWISGRLKEKRYCLQGQNALAAAQPWRGLSPVKWRICLIGPDASVFICEYSYSSNSFNLQCDTLAARAFVHVAMRFDELTERKYRSFQWDEHTIGCQLVDITQRALQCYLVLDDAQFRLAGV